MWSLRILIARLRPFNAAAAIKLAITSIIVALFLFGDFALFRRLFSAIAKIEATTPFFALGLLRNVLALAFLVAVVVLFSSSMTAAIGAFFTDLDLETYHASPLPKWRIVLNRWAKTLVQSATIIYVFLIPLFVAFAVQYSVPLWFFPVVLIDLALLLAIPVTLGTAVMGLSLVLVLCLIPLTWRQCRIWSSSGAIWEYSAARFADAARADPASAEAVETPTMLLETSAVPPAAC